MDQVCVHLICAFQPLPVWLKNSLAPVMPPVCRIQTPATVVHEKNHSWQDLDQPVGSSGMSLESDHVLENYGKLIKSGESSVIYYHESFTINHPLFNGRHPFLCLLGARLTQEPH